jgi:3-deoxy-D-manno-octulosonate 8-phosphate phosphatase (KDO 8-P phosphatase)
VRKRAHYVARAHGGHGAVREVCEFILRAQGMLERAIGAHLQ